MTARSINAKYAICVSSTMQYWRKNRQKIPPELLVLLGGRIMLVVQLQSHSAPLVGG